MKRKGKNPAELVIFANPRKKRAGKRAHKPAVKPVAAKGGKGGRKNPDPELVQAVQLFETFQGRPAREVIKQQRSAAMRATYTAIGPLLAIGMYAEGVKIPSPDHWENYPHLQFTPSGKDMVRLAANPEGSQLYAIGGNQDCSDALPQIEGDGSKDLVDFGEIAFVVYEARKAADNFQLVEYMHEFARPRPVLVYDQIKKEISFIGGVYSVEAPGIIN